MPFAVSFSPDWILRSYPLTDLAEPTTAEPNSNIVVSLFPQWFKQISLSWTIPSEWGNCKFHVYVSQREDSGLQRLTTEALTSPNFTNTQSHETSKDRSESYVVEALLPTGQVLRSFPSTWVNKRRTKVDLIASEIQRREYMLLTKFVGVKSYLFKAKYFGLRCPRCWNAQQEKVMDDKCPTCYGTSWDGGYFDPVPVYLQYDPEPKDKNLTYFGNLEPNQLSAWTISVPDIDPKDVIVRVGDWNVYSVVRNAYTELQAVPVRQMLTLTQLSRNDIQNALLKRQVLDDFGTYLESLGGDYSQQRFPRAQVNASPSDNPAWDTAGTAADLPVKYQI